MEQAKLRKIIREEIKTNYSHLSLKEQRELEEGILSAAKGVLGGLAKAGGKVAGAVGSAIGKGVQRAGAGAIQAGKAVGQAVGQAATKVGTAVKTTAEDIGKELAAQAAVVKQAYDEGNIQSLTKSAEALEKDLASIRAKIAELQKGGAAPPAAAEALAENIVRKLHKLNKKNF